MAYLDDKPLREQTSDELKKNLKASKCKAKKGFVLVLAAVFVFAFVTVAWFINSSRTNALTSRIEAAEAGFELATVGADSGYYAKVLESDTFEWQTEWFKGTDVKINNKDGTTTNVDCNYVNWLITADSNFGNNKLQDEEDEGISPGTSGELTFYVIPNQGGNLTLDFTLNLSLYNYNKQLINGTINQLFAGHLMFFESKSDEGIYSDWIEDGTFTKTFTEAVAGKAYPVTIYWVWPYVFGQLLLPKGSPNLPGDIVLFDDAVREKLETNMINSISGTNSSTDRLYFYSNVTINDTEITSEIIESIHSGTYTAPNYTRLSQYYNYADQYIGDNVTYILLNLTAAKNIE
jgi:hypothetical protein